MATIRWLHLTDLHRGMGGLKDYWPTVEEAFFEDLEYLRKKAGRWDLVLFTGDLTQRGTPEEFSLVDQLLERFKERLHEPLGAPFTFLAVPGNHDLTRPDKEDPSLINLLHLWKKPFVHKPFWDNPESPQRGLVNKAFANYKEWWGKTLERNPAPNLGSVRDGMLPGDFSATFEKEGVRLGIVGLNTAFLHLADVKEGSLELHIKQFHEACGEPAPDWIKKHDACLLLTHHPRSWLTKRGQVELDSEIYPPGRFAAHIFGHMHEPGLTSISEGAAMSRRSLQGASLFGVEGWGKGAKEGRIHGYSLCELEVLDGRAELRIWPRLAVRQKSGKWDINPDGTTYTLPKGHECTAPLPVHLLRSRPKENSGIGDADQDKADGPAAARRDSYGNLQIPPHYLPRRDVVDRVCEALLGNNNYTVPTVLHGMGGIGKTVIARAVCDESAVQRRFSDGILSTTLGQTPDIVKELRRWVEALGGTASEKVATREGLKSDLVNLLSGRKCLLVVDDAWHWADAESFRAGGPDCRLLITTRIADIAHKMGTHPLDTPMMSQEQSLELLEAWAVGKLAEVERALKVKIVEHLGMLPLAIKLAGAALSKQPADKWLETFDVRKLKFSIVEHPHDNLKMTFDSSLDLLDEQLRQRYASLAIFREDEPIPEAAIEKLWGELYGADAGQVAAGLEELSASALVQMDDSDATPTVRLHDLLRGFISTELGDEGESAAHSALLDGYRKTTSRGAWDTAPDDGYIYDHLVYHLKAVNAVDEIKSLFITQNWMKVRVLADNYNYDGYLADMEPAMQLAAEASPADEAALADCYLYALIRTSLNSISANYDPALIARAVQTGHWTFDRAASVIAKKDGDYARAECYAALLPLDHLSPEQRELLENEGIKSALSVPNPEYKYQALSLLLQFLSGGKARWVVELLIKAAKTEGVWLPDRLAAVIAVARYLNEREHAQELTDLLMILAEIQKSHEVTSALAAVAVRLSGQWREDVEKQAFEAAKSVKSDESKCWQMISLIPALSGKRQAQATQLALDTLPALPMKDIWFRSPRVDALLKLAGQVSDDFVPAVLDAILVVKPKILQIKPMTSLARRLKGEHLTRAWKAAKTVKPLSERWVILAALAPQLAEREQKKFIKELTTAAKMQNDSSIQAGLLATLATLLDGRAKEGALRQALAATKRIENPWSRSQEFAALVPLLSGSEQAAALRGALNAAQEWGFFKYLPKEIKAIIPSLEGESLSRALGAALVIDDESWRAEALAVLAHQFTGEQREAAVKKILDYLEFRTDVRVISKLLPLPSDDRCEKILQDALNYALKLPETSPHSSLTPRAEAVLDLASHLTGPLLDRAVEATLQMADKNPSWSNSPKVLVMEGLAPYLRKDEHLRAFFEAAMLLPEPEDKANVMAKLAPKLTDDLVQRALEAVQALPDVGRFGSGTRVKFLAPLLSRLSGEQQKHYAKVATRSLKKVSGGLDRSVAIEGLAPHLPPGFLEPVIKLAKEIAEPDSSARALAALALRLSGQRKEEVIGEALDRALTAPESGIGLNPRIYALSYVGNQLSGEQWERGWSAATATSDEEQPLRALRTFLPSAPDPQRAAAGVRRAMVNHLQFLSRRQERTSLLYFTYTDKSLGPPILSPGTVEAVAGYVLSVCYNWHWL